LNAFSVASTILGTIIGFLTGIYVPVGALPESVQMVVKCFPMSHAAVLLRRTMMAEPMSAAFSGAPPQVVEEFEHMMGFTFKFGDTVVTPLTSVVVLLASAIVFFAIGMWNLSRKKT
jgi:multidrug/hemolysin transport system permease protein